MISSGESTKNASLMTSGAGILVLGRGHIVEIPIFEKKSPFFTVRLDQTNLVDSNVEGFTIIVIVIIKLL